MHFPADLDPYFTHFMARLAVYHSRPSTTTTTERSSPSPRTPSCAIAAEPGPSGNAQPCLVAHLWHTFR